MDVLQNDKKGRNSLATTSSSTTQRTNTMKQEESRIDDQAHGKSIRFTKQFGVSKLSSIHIWLRNNFGKACKCEQCPEGIGVKTKRYDWALKHGCEYDYKVENFIQLCRSCHRKYDDYQPVNRAPVLQIHLSKNKKMEFDSVKQAARETGIIRTSIMNALAGRSLTAGGFIWKYKNTKQ